MENLNDVEFGSDKSEEEAPILVAQRYLNIFRQIHIFSKEKREQFDNELLALPQNVLDFYKKMPGGRLLMEHIEEIKTERGISFVKTNKDDFSYDTSTSSGGSSGGVPTPVVGGNLVMDASFAETLAQSMATAFKGVPTAAPIATGASSNVAVKADFGNAFDLIAEEIRTSRASLLDVLKETRNITDTVIASQVSISRVLEGLLATKNRDETDVANLNNKIIASQASITKLLEGLYSASTSKNEEISNYLSVDNKLQEFRNDLTQTIMGSLSGFADRTSEASDETLPFDIESRLSAFKSEVKADVNKSLSEIKNLLANFVENDGGHASLADSSDVSQESLPVADENWSPIAEVNTDASFDDDTLENHEVSENSEKKKKKKKKKKKALETSDLTPAAEETAAAVAVSVDDSVLGDRDVSFVEDALDNPVDFPEIQGEEPDLDISVESNPLLDIQTDESLQDDVNVMNAGDELSDILSDLDNADATDLDLHDDNLTGPADFGAENDAAVGEADQLDDLAQISDIDLSGENVSDLPENNVADEETSADSLDDLLGSTDIVTEEDEGKPADELPEQPVEAEESLVSSDLDSFLTDEAPTVSETEKPDDLPEQTFSTLDDLAGDDDLDFALPNEELPTDTASDDVQKTELGTFVSDDDLDFALPKDTDSDEADEKEVSPLQDEEPNFEATQDVDVISNDEDTPSVLEDNDTPRSSRYSAELDKIREALTSDNVDLASLDQPIALDDYSDDENVSEEDSDASSLNVSQETAGTSSSDEDWEYEYVEDDGSENSTADSSQSGAQDSGDWEWEYVDENGNPAPVEDSGSDDDWEWEYVEDDGQADSETPNEDNNNKQ